MRDTLRDIMIGIGAVAALFAAFQSWKNGQDIAAISGSLDATQATVNKHIGTIGLHR